MYLPNWEKGDRVIAQKETMCDAYVPNYTKMPFPFTYIQKIQFISMFVYCLIFYELGEKTTVPINVIMEQNYNLFVQITFVYLLELFQY